MTKPFQDHADGPWSYPVGPSLDAADMIAPRVPRLRNLVFREVEAMGAFGTTVVEMADKYGLDRMSVQPRFSELRVAGKIVDSGRRRKNPSGILVTVWTLPQYATKDGEGER